jgi:hypothetical protein
LSTLETHIKGLLEAFIEENKKTAISAAKIAIAEYKKEEAEKLSKKEPEFPYVLKGVKKLNKYLNYKDYWHGSDNTLNKKTADLLILGEKQGHGLIFRQGEIDHAFQTGFAFKPVARKSPKKGKQTDA